MAVLVAPTAFKLHAGASIGPELRHHLGIHIPYPSAWCESWLTYDVDSLPREVTDAGAALGPLPSARETQALFPTPALSLAQPQLWQPFGE